MASMSNDNSRSTSKPTKRKTARTKWIVLNDQTDEAARAKQRAGGKRTGKNRFVIALHPGCKPVSTPDDRLLKVPDPRISHPYDGLLRRLAIPALRDMNAMNDWASLVKCDTSVEGIWAEEVKYYWGHVLWNWSMADPLAFFIHISVLLDKVARLTGISQDKSLAAVNVQMLPLLRDRVANPSRLNGFEAIAITGMTYLALKNKDGAAAETHMRAVQQILDAVDVDRNLWMYVYWTDIRVAGMAGLRPFLRRFAPADWPSPALASASQVEEARRNAWRNIRAFGNALGVLQHQFFSLLDGLHRALAIRETQETTISREVVTLYNLSFDACVLHADVQNDPEMTTYNRNMVELIAIAVKLCVWNLCWVVAPSSGKVQDCILRRAAELVDSTLKVPDAVESAHALNLQPKAILWLLYIFSAESFAYLPEMRSLWIGFLQEAAKSSAITSQRAFDRALSGFPCTGPTYARRRNRAWQSIMPLRQSSWQVVGELDGSEPRRSFGAFLTMLDFQVDKE